MHTGFVRFASSAVALTALIGSAACGNKDAAKDAQGRAIELAPASKTPSALNDNARPVSNNTSTPSRRSGTIAAGTAFGIHSIPNVCTNTHHAGDVFTAVLNESVQGSNGVSMPAGSTVQLRVVESKRSEDSKDHAKLVFAPVSISVGGASYDMTARVTSMPGFNMERAQSTMRQAEKVAAGTAVGAVVGQVAGKNTKSTVIGAVVGTAAGAGVAAATADYDACVPNTGTIQVTLDKSLTVRAG